MSACLVLGATGFIGGHIVKAAMARGWKVRALRRNPQATGNLNGITLDWVIGNLADPDSLLAAMQGMEIVFHAAAYYPTPDSPIRDVPAQVAYALQEIENVLGAAKKAGVRRLIFTSTLTTIGNPPEADNRLADERDFYVPGTLPDNGYYESKFAMERRLLQAAADGFPVVIVNPTAVFGPGDIHSAMGKVLRSIARGWGIAWVPVIVNVIDVRDTAAAHLAAADKGKIGERYILGGDNLSMRETLNIVARVAGVHPPRFEIPLKIIDWLVALGQVIPSLSMGNHLSAIRHWQGYNTEKARRVLGLSPRPLDQIVRDMLDYDRQSRRK